MTIILATAVSSYVAAGIGLAVFVRLRLPLPVPTHPATTAALWPALLAGCAYFRYRERKAR